MKTFVEVLEKDTAPRVALGHFNISDSVTLRAIFESARELSVPVIIGVSEGERDFLGVRQAVALVRSLREEYDFPIFLNADHTHSLDRVTEAAEAGFDAVLFDGGKLPFEENIKQTREVVKAVRKINKNIIVEGEIGYIGGSSALLKETPAGAAVSEKDLTTAEQAAQFVKETLVDLLAPAVGNLHGMFANAPNPRLDIARIGAIARAARIPLVLHGGSGIGEEDFAAAIKAGVRIVHINTEIRLAWRQGMESGLKKDADEVAPYKIYPPAYEGVKKVVTARLRLFNGL